MVKGLIEKILAMFRKIESVKSSNKLPEFDLTSNAKETSDSLNIITQKISSLSTLINKIGDSINGRIGGL
jgi:hypothetical protein